MSNILPYVLCYLGGGATVGAWWWWIGHRAKIRALAALAQGGLKQAEAGQKKGG